VPPLINRAPAVVLLLPTKIQLLKANVTPVLPFVFKTTPISPVTVTPLASFFSKFLKPKSLKVKETSFAFMLKTRPCKAPVLSIIAALFIPVNVRLFVTFIVPGCITSPSIIIISPAAADA
jgi:hypothetical protein